MRRRGFSEGGRYPIGTKIVLERGRAFLSRATSLPTVSTVGYPYGALSGLTRMAAPPGGTGYSPLRERWERRAYHTESYLGAYGTLPSLPSEST
jgi:hypothetical protein